MPDDLTSGTVGDVDQAPAGITPQAEWDAGPWGINPRTGEPYKRDPNVMRRVREARFSGGKSSSQRAAKPKAAKAAGRPATPRTAVTVDRAKTAAYGAAAGRWFLRATDSVLRDPVERGIMRRQAVDLALIVDKLLQEDARILAWIDRLRLRLAGGAKGELLAWSMGTAALFALQRGYKHPILEMAFRAQLDAIAADAIVYERAQEAERQEMVNIMTQFAQEQDEILKTYAGNDVLSQFGQP